jgi:hypothetical protein
MHIESSLRYVLERATIRDYGPARHRFSLDETPIQLSELSGVRMQAMMLEIVIAYENPLFFARMALAEIL